TNASTATGGVHGAESAVLDAAPSLDVANNVTLVTLARAPTQQYIRSTAALMANVVEVTQGETGKDEILGSSNGGAFQSDPLKQKPLTYLPSSGSDSLSAVSSTLGVTVNGVAWTELPTLVGSAPHDQVFTTTLDDSGQTTVVFGDGLNGSRPPTGAKN